MNEMLILKADDVSGILKNQEEKIIGIVAQAYSTHYLGQSSLPYSVFLRFPHLAASRIIGLPGYLGGGYDIAGMKWIASFPENTGKNLPRASAVIALNDMATGFPAALLEASIISSKRTAASAALAARLLHGDSSQGSIGLIGTGPINFEVLRFLRVAFPGIRRAHVHDLSNSRAEAFCARAQREFGVACNIEVGIAEIFERTSLVSFATTAGTPHVYSSLDWAPETTVLHVSLRDLSPAVILKSENYVDDLEHVCRESTSIDLTYQEVRQKNFVKGNLQEWLDGRGTRSARPHVFSPFGLGILDLAVSKFVLDTARERSIGYAVENFLPQAESDS